jgi:hypothetical protein
MPECGNIDPAPWASLYLWIMTGEDDVILKESHPEISLGMMIRVLKASVSDLRMTQELPEYCKHCGQILD